MARRRRRVTTTSDPADGPSDERLLAAVAAGDREALGVLYRRHAPWLLARLSRRCADPALVDQAVQDTFLAVWRTPSSYRGTGEVAAWIWGIGVRRMIDQVRRHRPLILSATHEALTVSAEDEVLVGVEHGSLETALAALSPELRAVVQATVLDGLTSREAARLLGIPAGTVKTRMQRARRELRAAVTPGEAFA
jgi:RNA polymerase sigma-70 factor, ECF subfamily